MMMRWVAKQDPPDGTVELLTASVTKDVLLSHLLVQRGVHNFEEAQRFFRMELEHLHSPHRMKDMEVAVERIERARMQREHVMIFGDYDVDGTTSVALMMSFLRDKLPFLEPYIPDRYKEGYGLSFAGINLAQELGITLIIALDCGIKAFDQIAHARNLGIDVIVCDHHTPAAQLPKAAAILDPKRSDCPYPYKELSGCGVGFKLCQALCERWGYKAENELFPLLDVVAVSIAADIVPVTGENRVLAHFGMELLRSGKGKPAFGALVGRANRSLQTLSLIDVAFSIAPRINAAGRMESGLLAVELMLEEDAARLSEQAEAIDTFNTERRKVQQDIFEEALEMLDPESFPNSNVLYHPEWHKGVVGIVAAKMVEQHYRPTIILTKSGNHLAGSARSVRGFDVYKAIESCEAHISQFGGHKYAAGLTLHEEQLPKFKEAFDLYCGQHLTEDQKTPEISFDREARIEQFTLRFYKILAQLEPHGEANGKPIFLLRNVVGQMSSRMGADEKHLRTTLQHHNSTANISAVGFGLGHWADLLNEGNRVDVLAELTLNTYRGNESLQLMIKDLRPHQSHGPQDL